VEERKGEVDGKALEEICSRLAALTATRQKRACRKTLVFIMVTDWKEDDNQQDGENPAL